MSAYILGIISAGGFAAKFLNSLGYFLVASCIVTVNNIRYCMQRRKFIEQNDNLEVEVKRMPKCATLKQTAFYTEDSLQYKYKGIFLSLFCGLLNLGGEFCVVLCF